MSYYSSIPTIYGKTVSLIHLKFFFHEHRVSKYRYKRRAEKFKGVFLGKIQIRISETKNGFCVFGANQKTDNESMKYKLRVDSSDQIQIRIFETHNLKRFFWGGEGGGKELKKSIFDKRFQKKNGTQRMPHM